MHFPKFLKDTFAFNLLKCYVKTNQKTKKAPRTQRQNQGCKNPNFKFGQKKKGLNVTESI